MSDMMNIMIPGLKGFRLQDADSGEVIWHLLDSSFNRVLDLELFPANTPYSFSEHAGVLVQPGDLETAIYGTFQSFVAELDGDYLLHRYDWRLPSLLNSERLVRQVNQHPQQRLRIFAHSLGTYQALLLLANSKIDLERIEAVVFLSPPFAGIPTILEMLILGQDMLDGIPDEFSRIFSRITRSFPTLFELLPVYAGAVKTDVPGFSILKADFWPSDLLQVSKANIVRNLRYARDFRRLIHPRSRSLGLRLKQVQHRLLALTSIGQRTLSQVSFSAASPDQRISNYFHLRNTDRDLAPVYTREGDGRVPLLSASGYQHHFPLYVYELDEAESSHGAILEDPVVYDFLNRFLKDGDSERLETANQVAPIHRYHSVYK